ncbi:hypothetical protein CALCODRAFT_557967 [Calocera cornea HHB12733]|uniref:Uncharacterized protein n=1 Tax=Calocera cornea HHB12733 TaxID=1353952 RepID=A0A165DEL7_9BASI|nr:hypothetical protein CALCODRAFT_557967 [Calocera cornea HHB12733]
MSTPRARGAEAVSNSETSKETASSSTKPTNSARHPPEKDEKKTGTSAEMQIPDSPTSRQTQEQTTNDSSPAPVTRARAFSGTINDWSRERRDLSLSPEGRQRLEYRTLSSTILDVDALAMMAEAANLPPLPNAGRTQNTAFPSAPGRTQPASTPIPVRRPAESRTSDPPAWFTRGGPGWTAPYASSDVREHGGTRTGTLIHERRCPAMEDSTRGGVARRS